MTSVLVNVVDGAIRRGFECGAAPATPPANLRHLVAAWMAYGLVRGVAVVAQSCLAVPLFVPALLYGGVAATLLKERD